MSSPDSSHDSSQFNTGPASAEELEAVTAGHEDVHEATRQSLEPVSKMAARLVSQELAKNQGVEHAKKRVESIKDYLTGVRDILPPASYMGFSQPNSESAYYNLKQLQANALWGYYNGFPMVPLFNLGRKANGDGSTDLLLMQADPKDELLKDVYSTFMRFRVYNDELAVRDRYTYSAATDNGESLVDFIINKEEGTISVRGDTKGSIKVHPRSVKRRRKNDLNNVVKQGMHLIEFERIGTVTDDTLEQYGVDTELPKLTAAFGVSNKLKPMLMVRDQSSQERQDRLA